MSEHGEVFTQSYWRILSEMEDVEKFVDSFYERFLESSPLVKEKFQHTDFERQRTMLAQSFLHMENAYTLLENSERLQEIAEIHSKRGRDIPARLYDLWLDCLVKTAEEYDTEFSPQIEAAWRTVMGVGISYMKSYTK